MPRYLQLDPDRFNMNPTGLLDHYYLNADGEPDVELLRRWLAFGREDSRKLTSFEKSNNITLARFLTKHEDRTMRAVNLWHVAGSARRSGTTFLVNGIKGACSICPAFAKVLPGWHMLSGEGDTPRLTAMTEKSLSEMRSWFDSMISEELASVAAKKILNFGMSREMLFVCASEIFLTVLEQIKAWITLEESVKQTLAEASFGCMTLFGPAALYAITQLQPDVLRFFGHLTHTSTRRKKPYSGIPPIVTIYKERVINDDSRVAPASWAAFYAALHSLARRGIASPNDSGILAEVEAMVGHLATLKALPVIDVECIMRVFEAMTAFCEDEGKNQSLTEFEDPEFIHALRQAWYVHLDAVMRTPISDTFYAEWKTQTASRLVPKRQALCELRLRVDDLDHACKVAEKAVEHASNFRDRRESQKVVVALQRDLSHLEEEMLSAEEALVGALLPPEVIFETLQISTDAFLPEPEHYHPDAIAFLQKMANRESSEVDALERPSNYSDDAAPDGPINSVPNMVEVAEARDVTDTPVASEARRSKLGASRKTAESTVTNTTNAVPALKKGTTTKARKPILVPARGPLAASIAAILPDMALPMSPLRIGNDGSASSPSGANLGGQRSGQFGQQNLSLVPETLTAAAPQEPKTLGDPELETVTVPEPTLTSIVGSADSLATEETIVGFAESASSASVNGYLNDATEVSRALLKAYQTQGMIAGLLAENVALHWLAIGYTNFAYGTLATAEKLDWVESTTFNKSLLRAAYFGCHVWPGDQVGISAIQKELNFISHQVVEDAMAQRGGKVVPYLVLCASLHASLFSGNYTNAPRLLDQIKDAFDPATKGLLSGIVEFSNTGNRLDLESLRMRLPLDSDINRLDVLRRQLSDWRDRIVSKQTGWAPARMAIYDCLTLPEFMQTIEAVSVGSHSSAPMVQAFVDKYADIGAINTLIDAQVSKVQAVPLTHILRNARVWMQNTITELTEIARLWLIENRNRVHRNNDTQTFATRLLSQLRIAQSSFRDRLERATTLEHRAGAFIVLNCINHLLKAIEGQTSAIWPPNRVIATFTLADDLFAIENLHDDSTSQMLWYAQFCAEPLDLYSLTQRASQAQDFRLSHMLLLLREELGENVAAEMLSVKKHSDADRHLLRQKADAVRAMVQNASLVGLIEDDQVVQLTGDIEYLLDQIKRLDALDSVRELSNDVDAWERELLARFSDELIEKRAQLDDLLRQKRVQSGENSVSDAWQNQMMVALDTQNLPVADEMLSQLQASIVDGSPRVTIDDYAPNGFIDSFLAVEAPLFKAIEAHPNPREISKYLVAHPIDGVNLSQAPPAYAEVMTILAEWKSKPKKNMVQSFYDSLVFVMEYIGFEIVNKKLTQTTERALGFESGMRFKRASVTVMRCKTGRPFPFFDDSEGSSSQVNVLMAFSGWKSNDLAECLETWAIPHNRTVLLSATPMSSSERNQFATFCKTSKHSIFHVDPVMAAFIGTLPQDDNRLRNFLFLSTPWTYYNPYYQGDTRRPAPFEMRYGRQLIVKELMQQRGSAIVFGGRQLGKTTILHEAVRMFHKPENDQYAFYLVMDTDMVRLEALSQDKWKNAQSKVWEAIYKSLVKVKILPEEKSLTTLQQRDAIVDEFRKDGPSKVLICMDEIDPILRVDHAMGFGIFRGISELVNQQNGRFKVVIAGLENVKRFEDAPNFPLPQLGKSQQVSILDTKDAMQLVVEPLKIFGYEFENSLLASSILFSTNRHPGLLHIFCSELIIQISRRHKDPVGRIVITAADVEHVARDPQVLELTRSRFDMTLHLDKRYLVIIYALIDENRTTGYFTTSQAKSIAQAWLQHVFKPMSERVFEAFLDELVGLGVLRRNNEGMFALRSLNILKLVGSKAEVEEKLNQAIHNIDFDDPLGGHPIVTDANHGYHLSPLTYRDEKILINGTSTQARERHERENLYSVAILAGSEALGMDIERLKLTLPALGTYELHNSSKRLPYDVKHIQDLVSKGLGGFRTWLEGFLTLRSAAGATPLMLLVPLEPSMKIAMMLDLIDIAHELSPQAGKLKNCVRVVFMLSPKVLWNWLRHPNLTLEREKLQTFIEVDRWGKTALSHLLSQLGLSTGPNEIERLMQASQGWHFSLLQLLQASAKQPKARGIQELTTFLPFEELKPRRLQEFANKSGLMDINWAPELLLSLERTGRFDIGEIEIILQELQEQYDIDPTQAPAVLRWLERLRLIDPIVSTRGPSFNAPTSYQVNPSVALAVKDVVRIGSPG